MYAIKYPLLLMCILFLQHTMILPALLMETYILKHRHPRRKEGLVFAMAFGMAYFGWYVNTHIHIVNKNKFN